MTDAVQITLISCSFTFAGLAVSRYMSHREHMTTARAVRFTDQKVDEVHGLVNSKMEELMRAMREQGHAAGLAEGREQSIVERAGRVAEAERVEDREDRRTKPVEIGKR